MKKKLLMGLVFICTCALATVYGPFYVSALGPEYKDMTLGQDAEVEYETAQKMASLYLTPILNTSTKIDKAIRKDYIRLVYANGAEIADFKIKRWPSTIPVDFHETVPKLNTPRLSATYNSDVPFNCSGAAGGGINVTYQTGYWGSNANLDNAGNWNISGGWVSTGPFTIRRFAQACP